MSFFRREAGESLKIFPKQKFIIIMKKKLLFAGMMLAIFTATASAQDVNNVSTVKVTGFGAAARTPLFGTEAQMPPRSKVSRVMSGNGQNHTAYYKRPKGTLYLGWNNEGAAFPSAYISYPPYASITFENASSAPSATSWLIGTSNAPASAVNAKGDLTLQYGKNTISGGRMNSYYAPVLVNGADSFYIANSVANLSGDAGFGYSVFDWQQGFYYGSTGPTAAFGDASLGGSIRQVAWYQIFDKPVGSFVLDGLSFFVWCNGADFKTAAKDVKAYVYNVTEDKDGEKTLGDSVLSTLSLIADSIKLDEDWSSNSGGPGAKGSTYGIATFYPIAKDGFGGDMIEPVNLTDEFAIVVTGFNGKNLGFYYGTAPDYFITGTETSGTGDNKRTVNVYDDCISPSARFLAMDTVSKKVYDYYFYTPCYPVMFLNGYQDYNEFPKSVTLDDGTTTSFTEYNVPKAGGYAVSNADNSYRVQMFTALPWTDEYGIDNYEVNITYPDGEQPWLNTHEDDNSRKFSVSSENWDEYGLQSLNIYGDPLPEGKTGRHAYVTVTGSDYTGNRIVIRQGDDNTTGINGVTKVSMKNDERTYNLAGQKVDNSYKGIVIRGGRKYIQK